MRESICSKEFKVDLRVKFSFWYRYSPQITYWPTRAADTITVYKQRSRQSR